MVNLRSKLRRELLRYYFTNPSAEHHLREIARLLRVDPTNLSRELAELTRQRLFTARTRGRQKYFRLNRDHPLYDEFRGIVFKTVGVVGQLRTPSGDCLVSGMRTSTDRLPAMRKTP